ncbi:MULTISPECIES: lasso peptide biosynthesis PqqD family chaperone [unclassified Streptomyces]|uniref:lasso peptide biosynthesis PqqD family chaperone n=1 Tax=unclassified Streptomyces TaxID=2593676 RepID=UPI003669D9C0
MTFALAPHVTITGTDHGMVLLNERTGRYWQMNDTGALVLRCLLDGGTVESAVAALRERFPDAAQNTTGDVERVIAALRVAKVVTP